MPKQNVFAVGHGSCIATQHVYRPFAATRPCINITMGTHHGQGTSLATVQGQRAFAWAGAAARFPTVLEPLIGRDSVQLSPAVFQRHAAGPLQVEGRPLASWLCGAETSAGLPHLTRFFRQGHDGRTRRLMIRSTGSPSNPQFRFRTLGKHYFRDCSRLPATSTVCPLCAHAYRRVIVTI